MLLYMSSRDAAWPAELFSSHFCLPAELFQRFYLFFPGIDLFDKCKRDLSQLLDSNYKSITGQDSA